MIRLFYKTLHFAADIWLTNHTPTVLWIPPIYPLASDDRFCLCFPRFVYPHTFLPIPSYAYLFPDCLRHSRNTCRTFFHIPRDRDGSFRLLQRSPVPDHYILKTSPHSSSLSNMLPVTHRSLIITISTTSPTKNHPRALTNNPAQKHYNMTVKQPQQPRPSRATP